MSDPTGSWTPRVFPAERLTGAGIILRRWTVDDAQVLHSLVTGNVNHLRPWMPWIAHEPLTADDRRSLLREWERAWEQGLEFTYLIEKDGTPSGSTGLHARQGKGVLEIGYWVSVDACGGGVATAAARLLAEHAFTLDDVDSVEIHHDAANAASGRVAEKAGFERTMSYARDVAAPGESGTTVKWVLSRPGR